MTETSSITRPVAGGRLIGLDLVRGICALAVMVYHYYYSAGLGYLNGLGTYGVYIFFALSGFALFYRYSEQPIDEKLLRDFYISRCLRILPLFFAVALYRSYGMEWNPYNLVRLVVHGTPFIGLADPAAFSSVVVGGWSIVIEWSFYLLFPLLLLFRSTRALIALFITSLVLNYFFVLAAYFPPEAVVESRRFTFTDTFTFLCYFVGGMLGAHIYMLRADAMTFARKIPAPLFLSLALMTMIFLWPEVFDFASRRYFLSGSNALFLILVSCTLVFLASLQNPTGWLRGLSVFLGDISFALYLIHMYVWNHVGAFLPSISLTSRFGLSCVITIALAWVIHVSFEKPIRDIRKWRGEKARVRVA